MKKEFQLFDQDQLARQQQLQQQARRAKGSNIPRETKEER